MIPQKKIALILFSLQGGGAERNIINLYRGLKDTYKIHIVTVKNKNDYSEEYPHLALPVISLLHERGSIPFFLKPVKLLYLIYLFYRQVKKEKYDLFIAGAEYLPAYLAIIFSTVFNIKSILVITSNNIYENALRNKLMASINFYAFQLCFSWADAIVCVSEGLKKDILQHFSLSPHKITTIYNGIDHNHIQNELKNIPLHQSADTPYLVTVGRLVHQKGYHHLLRSFSIVVKKHPDITLRIVGSGPLESFLKKLARSLHIEKNVIFIGFDKPYAHLANAYFFIFSSICEGFGSAVVEALACGLPIISVNCPYGPAEIMKSKLPVGILTPAFNPLTSSDDILSIEEVKFAQAMIYLIDHPEKRDEYSNHAFKRSQFFSMGKMAHNYDVLIRKLLLQ